MAEVDLTYVVRAQDRTRAVFQQVTQSVLKMNATVHTAGEEFKRTGAQAQKAAEDCKRTGDQAFKASSGFKQAGQSAGRARDEFGRFTSASQGTARSFSAVAAAAQRTAAGFAQIIERSRGLHLSFRSLGGATRDLGGSVSATNSGLNNLLRTLGAVAVVGLATKAVRDFAQTGVEMNVTLDGARVALGRMTGSSQNAQRLLGGLRQEALASSLTFKEMLPIAQSLVGVLGAGGLGQVIPIMRAFGDTAAALQVPQAGLQNALLGFRQMLSKPLVQQEEVNQINESLPGANVPKILERAFGSADTEVLQKAGVTGQKAGEAIIQGLQQAFGGSQASMANSIPMLFSSIQDSVNDLSGAVTRGLTASLQRALKGVLNLINALQQTAGGQRLMRVLSAIFTEAGRRLEWVVAQAGRFLETLSAIAADKGIILFLANVNGFLRTLVETLLPTTGRMLQDVFSKKNLIAFFEFLSQGIADGVNAIFGMGRVFVEMGRIGTEAVQRIQETIADLALTIRFEIANALDGAFLGINRVFRQVTVGVKSATADILTSLSKIYLSMQFIPGFGQVGRGMEGAAQTLRQEAAQGAWRWREEESEGAGRINERRRAYELGRQMFAQTRTPDGDPLQRLGDAFAGRRGDTGPQQEFWRAFSRNRAESYQSLQGIVAGEGGGMGGGAAPSQARSGMVQPRSLSIAGAAQVSRDPFAPITLPNGQVLPRWRAEQLGIGAQGPTTPPLPAPVPTESASAASATATAEAPSSGISLPINIMQFDLTDPRFRARLHQLIDERLDFVTRRAGLRGAF